MADSDTSLWFTYLLNPARLMTDLSAGPSVTDLQPLLKDLLTNLLNNQHAGFFTDNPQELWYAKTRERKCLVLRNLSLQVAAYLSWRLATLESILPPPLLLYLLTALVQAQPDQAPTGSLANTASHTDLDLAQLSQPGPTLQALTLLHRWVVRTFMSIRTPARQERSSTVMVPGVRRDPAILYRDQTHTLVSAVAPSSIKFLAALVETASSPMAVPSHLSFPTSGAAIATDSGYSVTEWQQDTLVPADRSLALATAAYDLGCCYFFCEDYARARTCFASHFTWRSGADPTLGGEVSAAKLAGYCTCLGLSPSPSPAACLPSLPARLVTAEPAALVAVLAEDTLARRAGDSSGRECRELALQGRQGDCQASVVLLNLVSRSLKASLPLCLRTRRLLCKLPPSSLALLENTLAALLEQPRQGETRLLRCLVLDLIAADIISTKSKVATLVGVSSIGRLCPLPPSLPPSPCPSFLLLPASSDRIHLVNSTIQLLEATEPKKVAGLVASMGGRQARKVSSRWSVELASSNTPDLVFVLLAKAGQLRRLGGSWPIARELVLAAVTELQRSGSKDRLVACQLEGELLELEQLSRAELLMEGGREAGGDEQLQGHTVACLSGEGPDRPSPPLATSCLLLLLNCGDWEGVSRLSHTNMPYIKETRNSAHAGLFLLARHLGFLMLNLRSNSHQMVKKFGRDVWDTMAHLVSTAAGKRQKDSGGSAVSKERALVSSFLCRLSHPGLQALVLSLLASLYNVARDDPVTDILSLHASVWPTGLATNSTIQERLCEEILARVLTRALATQPQEHVMLRMAADLHFAAGRHSAALKHYLEAVAVRTDYFQLDCGPPTWLLEEAVVGRMVTSCRELGRLMQAVVLSQFSQEPNYAQAFKFLEDQTEDGGDSLYGCVWDMAILEFAMSLHTKRGEVARRRAAKHCIWQLELNTNNDEEILNEAANVRKAMFLRSLATQFF